MSKLSVWHDGEDWVIAADEDDAVAVMDETFGEYEGDNAWQRLDDARIVDVTDDDGVTKLSCREWVERNGRGHLCSCNY